MDDFDLYVQEMMRWHFSEETGCDFWLDWLGGSGWDPREEVRSVGDLHRFEHFDGEVMRAGRIERFVPRGFGGRPYHIFETGGTTGLPKQRVGWDDYKYDYELFSEVLEDEFFPRGANWLMLGPTGPRRLRLAIEHLANFRGGCCYFVDVDPRWVKKLIGRGELEEAERYMRHVIDQGLVLLKGRAIECVFTTPRLLEGLAERVSLAGLGVRGVFCGGTSMTPQVVRFLCEEALEGKVQFVPTYGNTLMGLACSLPGKLRERGYSVTYYAPQPRAVLRVVDVNDTQRTVGYGEYGRVELTTLTREFFMPRFLERDEGIRREPEGRYGWDGVGDVRPFGVADGRVIEGVY